MVAYHSQLEQSGGVTLTLGGQKLLQKCRDRHVDQWQTRKGGPAQVCVDPDGHETPPPLRIWSASPHEA